MNPATYDQNRFFLAPRTTWTDFERSKHLRKQILSAEARLDALTKTPQTNRHHIAEELRFLEATRQELTKIQNKILMA